ncbi:membrane progestin receptor beta-like [Ptychodera flava]|uniref:membrane progestin receptor beta-like n=1 Tax=Ptychodera flava TaxID=63121 RepID=UPI00396A0730
MAKLDFPTLPRTKSAEEVPKLFREPDVHNGYRVPHQPLKYYILSIFQMHNELLNVWTHLIACSILGYKMYTLSSNINFPHDPYSWPLFLLCVSCCVYTFLSTFAHLLQSHSELVHYTCFFIDYVGVSLYGFSSGLAHFYYSSHRSFLSIVGDGWLFPVVNLLLAWFACAACCYAKVKYDRPYPFARKLWQLTSVGSLYVWIISPILQRIFLCWSSPCDDEAIYHHQIHIVWFLLGTIFFATPFPQKLAPGRFDMIGHSHQLFHVFIALCTYCQMQAEFIDMKGRRDFIESHFRVNIFSTLGITLLLLFFNSLTVLWLRQKAMTKISTKRE